MAWMPWSKGSSAVSSGPAPSATWPLARCCVLESMLFGETALSHARLDDVKTYLLDLQERPCAALAAEDGGPGCREDGWARPEGGGGRSRAIGGGRVFEKG